MQKLPRWCWVSSRAFCHLGGRKTALEGANIVSSQHEFPIDIIRSQEVEPDQTSESGSDIGREIEWNSEEDLLDMICQMEKLAAQVRRGLLQGNICIVADPPGFPPRLDARLTGKHARGQKTSAGKAPAGAAASSPFGGGGGGPASSGAGKAPAGASASSLLGGGNTCPTSDAAGKASAGAAASSPIR